MNFLIVLRRSSGWSSVKDRDVGPVLPVGDVRGLGFRLYRSVLLIIYGGVRAYWSLLVMALSGWMYGIMACRES